MNKRRPKLVERERDRARRNARRRQEGLRFCELMGIKGRVDSLPGQMRKVLLASRLPKPSIVVDESAAGSKSAQFICECMSEYIENVCFSSGRPGTKGYVQVSISEFFTTWIAIAINLIGASNYTSNNLAKIKPRFVEKYGESLEKLGQHVHDETNKAFRMFWQDMLTAFVSVTSGLSRMESRLFWFTVPTRDQLQFDAEPLVLTIRSKCTEEIKVVIDDIQRRVFPLQWGVFDVRHISVKADQFGGPPGVEWPVYIQSHAIRKLDERMPKLHPVIQYYTYYSCSSPKGVFRDERGDWLIEYRLGDIKLGYLVCEPVDGKLVVKTFLLVTMQGTPEAANLYRRLRLTRYKIENLKLDTLEQFVETDIFDDPEIAAMMTECGLGDLARLRDRLKIESFEAVAETLKTHLKWRGPRPVMAVSERDFGFQQVTGESPVGTN